jgi:hypothetical protein
MSDNMTRTYTRRAALSLAVTAGGAVALVLAPHPAKAEPELSKAAVGYQDVPSKGKVCAQCVYFEFYPATSAGPASQCKLVAGNINPAGWCEVWAPKGTA